MKGASSTPREANLDHLLKEVLTAPSPGERPSRRVISAVMAQVRSASPSTRPFPVDALAFMLLVGGSLAWAAGRLLIGAVPALRGLLGLVGWRFGEGVVLGLAQQAYAAARGLVSLDFGTLFPLILLGTLIAFNLGVHWQRRITED